MKFFCKIIYISGVSTVNEYVRYLYLIVPFWYSSAAYSAEFGRAMVCILARRRWAKIHGETKKVRLGIYHAQIRFILYAKRWKDNFHRVKMCQAFQSSMCDCLWFENELFMVRIAIILP